MSPAFDILLSAGGSIRGDSRKQIDGFGTRAIHVGSEPNAETGAVIPPISLSTTYKQDAIGVHKVWNDFWSHLSQWFIDLITGFWVFSFRKP